MSRIINRAAEAAGGWEMFLYRTLSDVVEKVGLNGFTGEGEEAVSDAREILEAYEDLPDKKRIKATPTVAEQIEIRTEGGPEKVKPIRSIQESDIVTAVNDVDWKLEDLILTPAPRPVANPRSMTGRVHIDKDIGGSQGELPLPANCKLVNRQAILIKTLEGLVIGTACTERGQEGQIKSQHVTGYVSVTGKYRLAFTDIKLGGAHIQYEIVALPTKMTSKQFEEAIALANKLSVEELQERLKHFGMVYLACLCGEPECFGWRIVDQAEIQEATANREARLQAARSMGMGGGELPIAGGMV